jgi:uncharacterized OB-fold protein
MLEARTRTWPAPNPSPWSQPFWDAAKAGRLLIQHCKACGRHVFYPRLYCPHCLAPDLGWIEASGRGAIYSFTLVCSNAPSAFAAETPYVVAVIRLEEGVRLLSNVVGCEPDELRCEAAVEVVFERKDERFTLPKFRLVHRLGDEGAR